MVQSHEHEQHAHTEAFGEEERGTSAEALNPAPTLDSQPEDRDTADAASSRVESLVVESVDNDAAPSPPGLFPPAPIMEDEFRLPLDQLLVGRQHVRQNYDFEKGVGKTLLHVAIDPTVLTPVTVMRVDNVWHVIDGWARVIALRFQHGADATVETRVIRWNGTAKDAVLHRFSQTFLTLASKPIEVARQLAQVNALWSVPQQALAARIGWTESKVSKHLIAVKGETEEPRFAKLLLRADNPSIDYMYKVGKAMEEAARNDAKHPKRANAKGEVAALCKRLDGLLAKKERFEPKHALIALGLAKAKPEPELPFNGPDASTRGEAQEPLFVADVVGHDDVVLGALEVQADGARRLILPAVTAVAAMNEVEKAAARAAYREAVDRLFG